MTAEKDELIAELARLQDISVGLAEKRQSALEHRPPRRPPRPPSRTAEEAAQEEQEEQQQGGSNDPAPQGGDPAPDPQPDPQPPQPDPSPTPARPQPDPQPDPPPRRPRPHRRAASVRPSPSPEPRSASPTVGRRRPGAWDCSGLTMGAWKAGGKSLPHYSVAQYEQSTPISAGQLQPGDLSSGAPRARRRRSTTSRCTSAAAR